MSKSGSFTHSTSAIESQLKAGREQARLEADLQASQQPAEEGKKDDFADKVNKYLPEKIYSLSRQAEYSYADFKELYKEVWAAVASKDHLMTGSVTSTIKLGGSKVVIKSLSAREAQGLAKWENSAASGKSGEHNEYLLRRLVVQVQAINEQVFNKNVKLTPESVEEWEKDPATEQAYQFFREKDLNIIILLINGIDDLDMAKQLALTENLKRP